ncbi:hypothetical protein KP509_21G030300 [Ceratopteris richardii]|uniref:Methyltransferase type 11 domain-containing protein n=1 Tax=Ceratopteris richardii TaxID=49495 RepID=A0A8T2SAH2_CERRI|nr:hypothetical protein KP509_21G030300 [Ceratopteris richardii]
MASLFCKQAGSYATARPRYPEELYKLLASWTPEHRRAWDVGTGNGQSAVGLADYYEEVVATDVSEEQLSYAERRPNITYAATSAGAVSMEEVRRVVGGDGSLDLVTAAQAVHWFDLSSFYSHVQRLLKPAGIIAVWCYTNPEVNDKVDVVLEKLFQSSLPYWSQSVELVYKGYETLDFPFKPILDGKIIRMDAMRETNLDGYLGYLDSWSATNTARNQGVELLNSDVKEALREAWGSPSQIHTLRFPLYAKIGSRL